MTDIELQQYTELSKDLYQFVLEIMDYMKKPHDYGTGIILNMVEMHTLAMIADTPGMTVGEVAKRWNRTMSAASRNVERLCSKGYVEKRKEEGNAKNIHLYTTDIGRELAEKHSALDHREIERFAGFIDQKYSIDDLEKFRCMMNIIRSFYTGE